MRSQRHSRKKKVVTKKQSTGKDGPYHEILLQFKKEESVGGVFVFSAGGARRPASARSVQLIGGRDRPINPARRQERDGEDNAGQRRWAGALEKVAALRCALAAEPGRRCTGAVQIRISDHTLFSFQQAVVTSHTLVSLYFFLQINPSIFHVCVYIYLASLLDMLRVSDVVLKLHHVQLSPSTQLLKLLVQLV